MQSNHNPDQKAIYTSPNQSKNKPLAQDIHLIHSNVDENSKTLKTLVDCIPSDILLSTLPDFLMIEEASKKISADSENFNDTSQQVSQSSNKSSLEANFEYKNKEEISNQEQNNNNNNILNEIDTLSSTINTNSVLINALLDSIPLDLLSDMPDLNKISPLNRDQISIQKNQTKPSNTKEIPSNENNSKSQPLEPKAAVNRDLLNGEKKSKKSLQPNNNRKIVKLSSSYIFPVKITHENSKLSIFPTSSTNNIFWRPKNQRFSISQQKKIQFLKFTSNQPKNNRQNQITSNYNIMTSVSSDPLPGQPSRDTGFSKSDVFIIVNVLPVGFLDVIEKVESFPYDFSGIVGRVDILPSSIQHQQEANNEEIEEEDNQDDKTENDDENKVENETEENDENKVENETEENDENKVENETEENDGIKVENETEENDENKVENETEENDENKVENETEENDGIKVENETEENDGIKVENETEENDENKVENDDENKIENETEENDDENEDSNIENKEDNQEEPNEDIEKKEQEIEKEEEEKDNRNTNEIIEKTEISNEEDNVGEELKVIIIEEEEDESQDIAQSDIKERQVSIPDIGNSESSSLQIIEKTEEEESNEFSNRQIFFKGGQFFVDNMKISIRVEKQTTHNSKTDSEVKSFEGDLQGAQEFIQHNMSDNVAHGALMNMLQNDEHQFIQGGKTSSVSYSSQRKVNYVTSTTTTTKKIIKK
ncbi:hypothetical protein M9Y10_006335 [Tritrichomonas musculus]|uniref:Uncharacterized protein n=1 Tax=Tritrichomonas musculus TaxID=1915356 RepID=A0ABR2JFF4_9EUKA